MKVKKLNFKTAVIIMMMLSTLLANAQVAYTLKDDDVTIDDDGIITYCHYFNVSANNPAGGTDLTIPDILDGKVVKGIVVSNRTGSFSYRNIRSLVLPSNLEHIGPQEFYYNKLTKLDLPKSVTHIGHGAFKENNIMELSFSSNIQFIGHNAFSENNNLTSVTFEEPSNLFEIGEHAFASANLSQNIKLPNNKRDGFEYYRDINDNHYEENHEITEYDKSYFVHTNYTYTLTDDDVEVTNGNIDTCYYDFAIKNIIIPNELDGQIITSIKRGENHFGYSFRNRNITSLTLPENITEIDGSTASNSAFANNALSSINFPKSIELIGGDVFYNNKNLTSVVFEEPSNLFEIGERAFSECDKLTSTRLPMSSSLPGIIRYVDSNGKTYQFGQEITDFSVGYFAHFDGPYELTSDDVEVTNGNIDTCYYNFANKNIIIPDRLDNQEITGIGESVFYTRGIVSVQLPSTLTTIGNSAFYRNNLTSLTIPSSVQIIDENVFSGNKLTEVIFEENSNFFKLAAYAFSSNSNLQSVTLPKDQPDFQGYLRSNIHLSSKTILNPNSEGEYIITSFSNSYTYKAYFSTLKITFNPNGGDGEEVVKTYDIDTQQTFDPIFTREGYTLKEWSTKTSAEESLSDEYSLDEQHNVGKVHFTLYAQWEANEAVITYKDGELTETQSSVTDATVALLDRTVFDREGYTLENWNTEADGSGTMYAFGFSDFSVPAGGITLHLIKTANPATLTYKANYEDATEEDKTQDSNTDESVMLLGSEAFTRAGYSFSGWNTESDGSGDSFAFENDYITPSGGMTFYAQWEPNESMLTYYPNYEGTAEVSKEESSFTDAVVTLLGSDAFSRDDYTLSGWSSDPNAEEATYEVGASFTMPVDGADLYAVWALNTDLFYYANYEGGSTEPVEYKSFLGAKVSLGDGVSFVRDDYAISGWNTQANGGEESRYKPGEEYEVPSGGMTFYAEWSMKATLTYHANYEGSSDIQSVESYDGEEVSLGDGVSFVRDGFVLTGWNTQEDGNGDSFAFGDDYMTPLEGMTFYAVWSESATVTFVSNYEESTSENVVMASYVGEALTLPGETFTRVGYTLTGWNAADNDGGEVLPTGSIYEVKAREVMLYAQWEANEVALAYNANYEGSTNQDIRQDSRTDESVMLLESNAFTRAGYTLTSWNTQPDGLGDLFALGVGYTTPSEGMTFYAQWEANEVAISYNANYEGSTNQDIRQDSRTDESVMLLGSNAFTREGYSLTGWNTQPDGLGDSFALGVDYVTPPEGMTFYAVWEKEETVLSLSDELNGSMMQSYPNPVQNMLTVERSKAMRGQVNVKVFNMVGKEVYSKVYGANDDYMEVDFSALPMGMYFLQMSDENGDSERTRIMKR